WLFGAIGALGVLAPSLRELAGLVPRSFSFEPGRLVLHERALRISPGATTAALMYTTITFSLLQPLLLGGIQDALRAAERKLHLHAWHLRQLAPDSPRPAPDVP